MIITVEQAKALAKLNQKNGRSFLKSLVDLPSGDDLQVELYADFLYDCVVLAVEKGFPWEDVCAAVSLSDELSLGTLDCTLIQALPIIQNIMASYTNKMAPRSLQIFSEYFFSTYMVHFGLFRNVLTQSRKVMALQQQLPVLPPPVPESLSDGKAPNIFDYEMKMMEMEEQSEEKLRILREQHALNQPSCVSPLPVNKDTLQELSKEEAVANIVTEILRRRLDPLQETMCSSITEIYEGLSFKAEQQALPRPHALGPPPKLPLKPALAPPTRPISPARPKSAKGKKSPLASAQGKNK